MERIWVRRIMFTGMAVAAVSLMPATSAYADSVRTVPLILTSPAYSGYVVGPTAAAASVTTKFTVPNAGVCTATNSGIAPAAELLEANGTGTGAAVVLGCMGSSPFYEAAININSVAYSVTFSPSPGDVIKISATEAAGASSVTIKDVTLGQSSTAMGPGAVNSSAVIGMTALAGLPVPDFISVTFRHSTVDSLSLGGAVAYNMKTNVDIQIHCGHLSGMNKIFTDTFLHST